MHGENPAGDANSVTTMTFQVGDIVVVERKASPIGWPEGWVRGEMDEYIGHVGEILYIHEIRGIKIRNAKWKHRAYSGDNPDHLFWFHPDSLEYTDGEE